MACSQKPKKQKAKTHKSISKRIKITATGKVVVNRPGHRHLAISKSPKRRRQLRRKLTLSGKFAKHYRLAASGAY